MRVVHASMGCRVSRAGTSRATSDVREVTCLSCLEHLMKEADDEKQRKEEEWRAVNDRLNTIERRYLQVDAARNPRGP